MRATSIGNSEGETAALCFFGGGFLSSPVVCCRIAAALSRKLTSLFVGKWQGAHPDGEVIRRDLIKTSLPFVALPWIGGAFTPPEQHRIQKGDDHQPSRKARQGIKPRQRVLRQYFTG